MIRLHSLRIRRFRGIREGTVQGLTDVNLFVGKNNSGKSAVLEAICRLSEKTVLGRTYSDIWNQIRQDSGEESPAFWFKQDLQEKVLVKATIGDSTDSDRSKDVTIGLEYAARGQKTPIRKGPQGSLAVPEAEKFLRSGGLFRPPDALDKNIESSVWRRLLADRRDKALTKSLNYIFELKAEGFQLLPDNQLIVLFESHGLPLDVQGDGTRAAVRALMVLSMLKDSLMIFEEPECHQHPGSLGRFAQTICRSAREQQVQVIISTHSIECVRAFLKASQEAGSEGAVFHLTLEDGKQEARRLDPEAVETLQNTGIDIRFLDLYG